MAGLPFHQIDSRQHNSQGQNPDMLLAQRLSERQILDPRQQMMPQQQQLQQQQMMPQQTMPQMPPMPPPQQLQPIYPPNIHMQPSGQQHANDIFDAPPELTLSDTLTTLSKSVQYITLTQDDIINRDQINQDECMYSFRLPGKMQNKKLELIKILGLHMTGFLKTTADSIPLHYNGQGDGIFGYIHDSQPINCVMTVRSALEFTFPINNMLHVDGVQRGKNGTRLIFNRKPVNNELIASYVDDTNSGKCLSVRKIAIKPENDSELETSTHNAPSTQSLQSLHSLQYVTPLIIHKSQHQLIVEEPYSFVLSLKT